jgi:imidazolonepropionase-like amidohydrolase
VASPYASTEALTALVAGRVAEMRAQGTTTMEIKSGYGLGVADELRSLSAAGEFATETTFLGAHVVPPEWHGDRTGYLDLVTGPMLTAAASRARWIDVFCEPERHTRSTPRRPERCCSRGGRPGWVCGRMATNSALDPARSSQSN